ncbi:MAG: hypothetical protein ISR68_00960 [Campylobacterales bacterium]|nr:hypothetical protein [Campylobacterales bacterium]
MEVMNLSIQTHIFVIMVLIALVTLNLYRVFTQEDFFKLAAGYKIMTPFFHSINAAAAYTGIIVSAFTHDLSITIILMIATTIFIMVSEIKRYKKMRVIKTLDYELQDEFRAFAKKIAFMQLAALMTTFIVAKLF